jgi:plastocyanin
MHPRPVRAHLLVPLAAVVLLTTACSGGGTTPTAGAPSASGSQAPSAGEGPSTAAPLAAPSAGPTSAAPAPAPTITIAGFDYDVPASVEAGAQVQVVNEDAEAHTVTLRGGGASLVVQAGSTATLTAPSRAGSWEIVCDFHAGMTDTLVVR